MSSASPLKRFIRAPLSPPKGSSNPLKYEKRRSHSRSALYEDVLSGPFLASEALSQKSRLRVEKLAKGAIPENEALDELKRQLATRDQYIEALKDRFMELRVEAKIGEGESFHAKERLISQLCREKVELAKTMQALEAENQLLRANASTEPTAVPEDRSLEVEVLQEEVAGLQAQLSARETLLTNMKRDLSQLSEIISGMTSLNTELNDKVLKLNQDMEETNRNAYQAQAKAQHIEEIEKSLMEVTAERQKLETQVQKMREMQTRMQEMEETAVELKSFLATLSISEEDKGRIKIILSRLQPESTRKVPDTLTLKGRIKELEGELRTVTREFTKSKTNETALKGRIIAIEEEHKTGKKEMDGAIEQLKKANSVLQTGLKGLSGRYDKLVDDYQKTNSEVQRHSFRIALLQGKLEKASAAVQQAVRAEAKANTHLKEMQSQIAQLKSTKASLEASLLLRDQRGKEDAAKLKVATEELWKRDTQILKKSEEVFKLQEQMSTQKLSLQRSFSKAKIPDRLSPVQGNEARSHSIASPLKPFIKQTKGKTRTNQSRSLVFSKSPIEVPQQDRPIELIETLAKTIDTVVIINNEGSPAPSTVRMLLGRQEPDGNVRDALVEKMWRLVNELEDLVQSANEAITVSWMRERTRNTLGLLTKDAYMPAELLSILKATVRETEHID